MCSGKTSCRQELHLGMVNAGLGVFVGLHRTVNGGFCVVCDYVDVRGHTDNSLVREVDGLVVVTHGHVPADVVGLVHGIGAVVPLDVQHSGLVLQ